MVTVPAGARLGAAPPGGRADGPRISRYDRVRPRPVRARSKDRGRDARHERRGRRARRAPCARDRARDAEARRPRCRVPRATPCCSCASSRTGRWTLPGGWVDVGESPSEAVTREVREESGYETRAVKLLALYDRDRHAHPPHPWHIWKACFLCELLDGVQHDLDDEISETGFFTRDALPELDVERITPDSYIERSSRTETIRNGPRTSTDRAAGLGRARRDPGPRDPGRLARRARRREGRATSTATACASTSRRRSSAALHSR